MYIRCLLALRTSNAYALYFLKNSCIDCGYDDCYFSSFFLQECEREVLVPVLQSLEGLLQDRTLTLSAMTDLSSLCQLLCRLTSRPSPTPGSASSSLGSTPSVSSSGPTPSGSTPSTLQQQLQQPLKLRQPVAGSGFGDVSSFVYPVLATLASYPTHLDRKAQVTYKKKIEKLK